MSCLQLIFLLSIALQVSGALILIIFCWGNTERRILNTIYPANASIHREDDNTVIISRDKLIRAHKNVLLNRTAFILIGLGYLSSLFGSNEDICALKALVIVVIASVVILAVVVFAIKKIAEICNRKDKKYQYEELCSKLDSDLATNMIYSEIDEAFKV